MKKLTVIDEKLGNYDNSKAILYNILHCRRMDTKNFYSVFAYYIIKVILSILVFILLQNSCSIHILPEIIIPYFRKWG